MKREGKISKKGRREEGKRAAYTGKQKKRTRKGLSRGACWVKRHIKRRRKIVKEEDCL